MKSPTIDTIIFDVGKVLVEFDWESYLRSYNFDEETYRTIAAAVFQNPLWDEHDRGLETDEKYLELFIANAPQYADEIRQVILHDGGAIFPLDYADGWVKHLKEEGYKLYILSNYSRNTFEQSKDLMTFRQYMDGEIFSYRVHQRKPYHCIYHTILEEFSIDPNRAVFLDDRPENVRSACEVGIHGILFTGYPQIMEKLKEYGIQ